MTIYSRFSCHQEDRWWPLRTTRDWLSLERTWRKFGAFSETVTKKCSGGWRQLGSNWLTTKSKLWCLRSWRKVETNVRYLGVMLDAMANALARLMPNIDGSRQPRRKLSFSGDFDTHIWNSHLGRSPQDWEISTQDGSNQPVQHSQGIQQLPNGIRWCRVYHRRPDAHFDTGSGEEAAIWATNQHPRRTRGTKEDHEARTASNDGKKNGTHLRRGSGRFPSYLRLKTGLTVNTGKSIITWLSCSQITDALWPTFTDLSMKRHHSA